MKVQVIIDAKTKVILMLRFCKGSKHDFALFKETHPHLDPNVWYVVDSGYQGLQKENPLTCLPHKTSKHKPLTEDHKQENTALASFRIKVEHVIRCLKIWRILKKPTATDVNVLLSGLPSFLRSITLSWGLCDICKRSNSFILIKRLFNRGSSSTSKPIK